MTFQGATTNPPADPQETWREVQAGPEAILWMEFAAARSPGAFFRPWLAMQCGLVPRAIGGLLLVETDNRYAMAAVWPDDGRDVSQIAEAAGPALRQRRGVVHYLADGGGYSNSACVAHPVEIDGRFRAVLVVQVAQASAADLRSTVHQLRWGVGWLEALFRRLQSQEDEDRIKRMTCAMDILSDAGEQRQLHGCVVAVANQLAVRLGCSRVSIGLARHGRVRLAAISHSAVVEEKSRVVETIENAMEEALVQRGTVVVPDKAAAERRVSLAHRDLARMIAASASVASVVMTSADRAVGVITLERDDGAAFDPAAIQLLEVVAHLLGPLVEMKVQRQRLVTGRLVEGIGSSLTALVAPRRLAIKVAAAAILCLLVYGAFAQADFRVSGKALVEGAIQRVVVAPFEGYVSAAPVRAGDVVAAGQTLATLDDREMALEAVRARSDYAEQVLKYNDAMGHHDPVAARVAGALIEESKARLTQAEDKLARARIIAPWAGIVVSGDLSQMLGSPVDKGQVLFQLAPLDSYRVILQVDERDISFISTGQSGQLILTGFSSRSFPFKVKMVTPVATASEGRNFFRVEAEIADPDKQLRPGMEGVGKVSIARHRLLWIWTRPLVEWAIISAWKWTP